MAAPRGSNHHLSKLSETEVRAIRRLYAQTKVSQAALAAKFGVNQKTVFEIVNRKIWKHI